MICRGDSLGCLVWYESDDDSDFVGLASRHAPTSEGIIIILYIINYKLPKIICHRYYIIINVNPSSYLPLPLPFIIVGESDPAGSMTQAAPSPPSRDQLESLMPRTITQMDGALYSHSRMQSSGGSWTTYYQCRRCDACV